MRNRLTCLVLTARCLAAPRSAPALVLAPAAAPDTSWVARSVLYEVFVQDFSPAGDFRGVIDGLDRIQSVGANVVWLMPIHPIGVEDRKGTLGSPYAARDFRAINPAYGTAADFHALVEAVHARGHEDHPRLGSGPHLDRSPVGSAASRLLLPKRARRAKRAARPGGQAHRLDRRGAARLRQPGGTAGDDRHHALVAHGVRPRRLPGGCGRVHPQRLLA